MRTLGILMALFALVACSKRQGDNSTTASTDQQTTGDEMGHQGMVSETEAADSQTYGAAGATYSDDPAAAAQPGADTAGAQAPRDQQAAAAQADAGDVDIEAIRAVLLREYPNNADMIRAMRITEDGGVVTLQGYITDESARPGMVAVVERTPGVRDVNDQLKSGQQEKQ